MITTEQVDEFIKLEGALEKAIRSHEQSKSTNGPPPDVAEAHLRAARERLHEWLKRVSEPQSPVQETHDAGRDAEQHAGTDAGID